MHTAPRITWKRNGVQPVIGGTTAHPSDPKDQSTEAIRSLHNTRRSAVKARTAATNQITAMLITAPDGIRSK